MRILCHAPRVTLRRKDLAAVVSFVADAHHADGPEALSTELLDRLVELVGCEYATFETHDRPRQRITGYVPCSNEGPDAVDSHEREHDYWTTDDPLRPGVAPVYKLSDLFNRRERERIRDERRWNAEFRLVDTLGFRVGDRRTRSGWLQLDSQRRDFDERDRELALVLRPHVETLFRKAISRWQVAELVGALERDGDIATGRAIAVFDTDGRIGHATAEGRRLLATWFGMHDGRLPPELRDWLELVEPGARRVEHRNGSTLTIEAAGEFVLAMRERVSDVPRLTRREREILGLVADGLTNAEIARALWVAPTTVAKHLEHAYAKLGVHSRTAAVARLAKLSD
jgi:DNA-binding CsgD family transcriptional regulator